jgi:hypothetical protein
VFASRTVAVAIDTASVAGESAGTGDASATRAPRRSARRLARRFSNVRRRHARLGGVPSPAPRRPLHSYSRPPPWLRGRLRSRSRRPPRDRQRVTVDVDGRRWIVDPLRPGGAIRCGPCHARAAHRIASYDSDDAR